MNRLKKLFLIGFLVSSFLLVDNVIRISTANWEFIEVVADNSIAIGHFSAYSFADGLYDYFRYGFPIYIHLLNPYYGVMKMDIGEYEKLISNWYLEIGLFGLLNLSLVLGYREVKRFLSNPNHKKLKFQIPLKIN